MAQSTLTRKALVLLLPLLFTLTACSELGDLLEPDPPPNQQPVDPDPIDPNPVDDPDKTPIEGVRVIYDTDYGIDVDDIGALAVLHALADMDETTILGVVSNVADPYAPPAIDVVNTYYGRPDIPIGLTDRPYYAEAYPYWREHAPRFIEGMALGFPHDTPMDGSVPTATAVYRELLASQPDGSVTIISVGFLQNLADLLNSGPDEHSPLDGRALIEQKVRELSVMGGHYPSSSNDLYLSGGREMDARYAVDVIENWPTVINFNTGPTCHEVLNGRTLTSTTPETNPVRFAYEQFYDGPSRSRNAWDLCSVLYAVRGLSGPEGQYFDVIENEQLTLDASGYNEWILEDDPRHHRLVRVMPEAQMIALLEALLTQPPANPAN